MHFYQVLFYRKTVNRIAAIVLNYFIDKNHCSDTSDKSPVLTTCILSMYFRFVRLSNVGDADGPDFFNRFSCLLYSTAVIDYIFFINGDVIIVDD